MELPTEQETDAETTPPSPSEGAQLALWQLIPVVGSFRIAQGIIGLLLAAPILPAASAIGLIVCGLVHGLFRRRKWNLGLAALAAEWWLQTALLSGFFGVAANFQVLILAGCAVPLFLDHLPSHKRMQLMGAPIPLFLLTGALLANVSAQVAWSGQWLALVQMLNPALLMIAVVAMLWAALRLQNEQRSRLEMLAHSRGRLVANLSHELKTPISAIMTTAQTMLRHERNSDKYKQALALCERNSRSMRQLIRRMLDLSRASSNDFALQQQSVAIKSVITNCLDLHSPLAEDQGVFLQGVCRESLEVETDPEILAIMLNNLVGNAIRYTRRGKCVTVRCKRDDAGRSVITVSDEGPGVPPEAVPHIFDVFYRAEHIGGNESGNYGIGLALTAELGRRLNVIIEVESEPGQGAHFHMIFNGPPKRAA